MGRWLVAEERRNARPGQPYHLFPEAPSFRPGSPSPSSSSPPSSLSSPSSSVDSSSGSLSTTWSGREKTKCPDAKKEEQEGTLRHWRTPPPRRRSSCSCPAPSLLPPHRTVRTLLGKELH